ncbi:MAG: TonB-dependent receptor [Pseudomonadales bacterium]
MKSYKILRRSPLTSAVRLAIAATLPLTAAMAHAQLLEEVTVTATKRAASVMDVPLAITAVSGEAMRDMNLDDIKDLVALTPGVSGNSKDSFLDNITVRGIITVDFGIGGDPSISIYKNGLYQGRTGSAVTSIYDIERAEVLRGPQGFLFGRGAISGAMNVITTKPNTDQVEGYVELDVAERGHAVIEGAVNVPVTDNLAFRLAVYHSEEDGYVTNKDPSSGIDDLIGHEKDGIRLTTLFETDRLSMNLMLEYEDRDQSGTVYVPTESGDSYDLLQEFYPERMAGYPAGDRNVINDLSLGNHDRGKVYSAGLQIDYDFDFATLTSITGYKDHDFSYAEDWDGTPITLNSYGQEQTGDYFEQELRLTSNGDGPLSWYGGVSYYKENIEAEFTQQFEEDVWCSAYYAYYQTTCQDMFDYYKTYAEEEPEGYYVQYFEEYFGTFDWEGSANGLITDRNRATGKYEGYAAYVDVSYVFNDRWDASLGVRYTKDDKDFSNQSLLPSASPVLLNRASIYFTTPNGAVSDSKSWNDTSPRLVVNYRPGDDHLIFGSITAGYKSGGFSTFGFTRMDGESNEGYVTANPDDSVPTSFDPETSMSYELGYKGSVNDGNTRLAANVFFYQYEDMQVTFFDGPVAKTENAGKVDGYGFEGTAEHAINEHFNINLGFAYLHTEATDIQKICGGEDICEGDALPWSPELSGFAMLNAHYPMGNGEMFGLLSFVFEDGIGTDFGPDALKTPDWQEWGISAGYRTESWSISGYVDNLTDELYYDNAIGEEGPFPDKYFGPSRPRTAGVKFSVNF